jgi:Tol biopolymer transport system component
MHLTRTVSSLGSAALVAIGLAAPTVLSAGTSGGRAPAVTALTCTAITCVDANRPIFVSGLPNGFFEVVRMDPDGSHTVLVTDDGPLSGKVLRQSYRPSVNVGRSLLAYISISAADGPAVVVMHLDGTAPRIKVAQGIYPDAVSLSPDGTKVAIAGSLSPGDTHTSIYVVGSTGGPVTQLTGGFSDESPAWSPDGRELAFSRSSGGGPYKVFVMNANGSAVTQITAYEGRHPAWSPDGQAIAFSGAVLDKDHEIYWTPVATYFPHRVTTHPGMDNDPAWSPDGTRIAFDDMPEPGPQYSVSVFGVRTSTVNVDGTNQRQIATNASTPNWGYPTPPPILTQAAKVS